ncbi:MAG: peroxide stress protein YaaA [Bacteroidales bacterium]|nr:peroxide stress protein YaaA [Bacteroidales bacterium]
MIVVLSPAKSLNFDSNSPVSDYTLPQFGEKARLLAAKLKKLGPVKLARLLNISPQLALLNAGRYSVWHLATEPGHGKQAIFAFDGDVYDGLEAGSMTSTEIHFAQEHIRILSGLYGVLRPLDLIVPYRMEMGIPFAINKHKDLYQFWGKQPANLILKELETQDNPLVINLASQEYYKVIDKKLKNIRVITPVFKEQKGDEYKVLSFFAKRARGMMARFIIRHNISDPEHLKAFDDAGYIFNAALSNSSNWVFTRGQSQV